MLKDLDKWCVVDWPIEARDGYDFSLPNPGIAYGVHNVINAYYIGAIKALNKLAKIIDNKLYMDVSKLEKAFINTSYDEKSKLFTDSDVSNHISLPANAFALLFDLCPDKTTEDNIVDLIMKKDASCSAFFTSFASLASLVRLNREDLVLEFLKNEGRWLRMINEGATVTFEAWGKDVKWNTSLFHLCYTYAILFLTDWGFEDIFKEI